MTRTTGRPQPGKPDVGPTQQDLQTAYQIHTLAQMLYGRLATAQPWVGPTPPMGMIDPTMGPTMSPTMSPVMGPMMGPTGIPWAQAWPTWGGPYGHVAPMGFYWTGPSSYFGSELVPR